MSDHQQHNTSTAAQLTIYVISLVSGTFLEGLFGCPMVFQEGLFCINIHVVVCLALWSLLVMLPSCHELMENFPIRL